MSTDDKETELVAQYRSILLESRNAFVSTNSEGIVETVNPATVQLLGYRRSELIGHSIDHFIPVEYHERHHIFTKKFLETGIPTIIGIGRQVEVITKAGKRVPIELNIAPYQFKGETKFVGMMIDASARVHAEERSGMSERMATIGEMAAGVAHEINNPLTIISGNISQVLSQLERGEVDLEVCQKRLQKAFTSVERITRTVSSLKTVARFTGGDPFEAKSVLSVVDNAMSLSKATIGKMGVELRVGSISEDMMFHCRETEVIQILLNLIGNAAAAVSGLEKPWVLVEAIEHDNKIVLSVTDSGTGISPEICDRIMEPFFTTKPPGKGNGLGLAVSQRLAKGHGGVITLNREAVNTRFEVDFPKESPVLPTQKIAS